MTTPRNEHTHEIPQRQPAKASLLARVSAVSLSSPRCCPSHHPGRLGRTRRCRHPPPATLHAHGTSCVLRSFDWIMRGSAATQGSPQRSVGMHLLFPADVPAQSLSCYALECSAGEASSRSSRQFQCCTRFTLGTGASSCGAGNLRLLASVASAICVSCVGNRQRPSMAAVLLWSLQYTAFLLQFSALSDPS